MKTECILELMKEKDYVNIYSTGYDSMPMMYYIENKVDKDFGSRLFNRIKEDENYLIASEDSEKRRFIFCRKEDIDKWLEQFKDKEKTDVPWKINWRIDNKIKEYLEEKRYRMEKREYRDAMTITNMEIEKRRKEKEEKRNQEAIDLLEKVL